MKKWLFLITVVLLVVTIFSACTPQAPAPTTPSTPPATSPAAAPKIIKVHYDMSKTGSPAQGLEFFAQQVPIKTNGKYKVDTYPGQSLVKQAEALSALQAGTVDIAQSALSINTNNWPATSVLYLPSMHFPTTREGLVGYMKAGLDMLAKFPVASKELAKFKIMAWYPLAANILASKKVKIVVPDDLKGLKVGSRGPEQELVKAAGGAPVTVPMPEMYQNLEKGVIDASVTGWEQLQSDKIEEVTSYYLDYPLSQNSMAILMNLNSWNSLPPDVQQVFTDLMTQSQYVVIDVIIAAVSDSRKICLSHNKTITVPTPEQLVNWDKLSVPLDESWLNNIKSLGIAEGQEIFNFVKQKSAEGWKK